MSNKNTPVKSNIPAYARILALILAILVTSTTLVYLVDFIMKLFAK